jgi:hypothetical protein
VSSFTCSNAGMFLIFWMQPEGDSYPAAMFASRAIRRDVCRLREGYLRVSTSQNFSLPLLTPTSFRIDYLSASQAIDVSSYGGAPSRSARPDQGVNQGIEISHDDSRVKVSYDVRPRFLSLPSRAHPLSARSKHTKSLLKPVSSSSQRNV